MGMIQFQVPHKLSLAEAKLRMERLTRYWARHGIESTWNGEMARLSGKVMGLHLEATMRVSPESVGGEATDPGMLLRGQARKYLTHKLETWLDPKKSIEELERG